MTAAATRRKREPTVVAEPPVSKVLTDRIPADGEQVAHTLDPDRDPDSDILTRTRHMKGTTTSR